MSDAETPLIPELSSGLPLSGLTDLTSPDSQNMTEVLGDTSSTFSPASELADESYHNEAYSPSGFSPNAEIDHGGFPELQPLLISVDTDHVTPEVLVTLPDNVSNEVETSHLSEEETMNPLGDYMPRLLIPIIENEIADFQIEEVVPNGHYPMITNNLTSMADESFLYTSQNSLNKERGNRANTMQNLHERSSFLNLTSESSMGQTLQRALLHLKDDITFGSLAALNKAALKDQENNNLIDENKPVKVVASGKYMKNLLAICFTITLIFIALGAVRNLQSSINSEGGIGVICLAISFTGYMLGGLVSPIIVQNFAPRRCLIAGIIPHIIYTASNVYPTVWLMAPSAFAQGVALAIVWNTMSTYITLLARGKSQDSDKALTSVSSQYFGIFGLLYQSYFIIGNLIAALILQYASSPGSSAQNDIGHVINQTVLTAINYTTRDVATTTTNISKLVVSVPSTLLGDTIVDELTSLNNVSEHGLSHIHLCGAEFWQHYDLGGSAFHVSDETKYLLFGIYIAITIGAMLIAIFILEDLNPQLFESSVPVVEKLKSQMWSLMVFFKDTRFMLIFPILMFSYLQLGFVVAEISKAYITCPLGIYMVGYTMMCLGFCGSLFSLISGTISRFVGRLPQILVASAMNLGVLFFMLFWQPTTDSLAPYFIITAVWGAADGIWVSQINGCLGVIFHDKYEEAFAGLRVAQGVGACLIFGMSNSVRMDSKIYITLGSCLLGVACYLLMEVVIRKQSRKNIRLLMQTAV